MVASTPGVSAVLNGARTPAYVDDALGDPGLAAASRRRPPSSRRFRAGRRLSAREPFDFGPFRLDRGRRVLWRGDALVEVAPRALDLLVALVERAGDVVTKDELLQRVWPDTFVEEANLSVNVSALRKALGDRRDGPRVHPDRPPPRLPLRGAARGRGARRARRPSIAVPPLPRPLARARATNTSGWGRRSRSSPGLSRLSGDRGPADQRHPQVRGRARRPARGGPRPAVDAVVEGTVQRSGNRVRVTVHLVRVDEEGAAWSDTFEEEMTEPVRGAGRGRGAAWRARWTSSCGGRRPRAARAAATPATSQASQAYLKGRYFWSRFTGEWMGRAFACFQEAVERDPRYALPHAGLADAYLVLGFSGLLPPARGLAAGRGVGAHRRCSWMTPSPTPTSRWATCGCSATGTGRAPARRWSARWS